MNRPTCHGCTRPVDGTTLCAGCVKTLLWAIANIAAYLGDLDLIRTRRTRYGDPTPTRRNGGHLPLPVDARFTDLPGHAVDEKTGTVVEAWGQGTDLAWVARNTLTTWVRHLLEQHPHLPGPRRDTLGSVCAWLLSHTDRIRVDEAAAQILDELLDLERRLRRFVDRPPDRWYAGPCTAGLSGLAGAWICGVDLYAHVGKPEVVCGNCNATYPVADRREWLLAAAEDRWETATSIAQAVVVLGEYERGERRLVVRIGQWVRQGRLLVRGHTSWGERRLPLYRLGDVLNLIAEDARQRDERSA